MLLIEYFTDPVLRGPTIGCMLMCLAAALVGVITFLRKQSLLGESLSHATYPGVNLAVIVYALFFPFDSDSDLVALFILCGAFVSAMIGLCLIWLLEEKLKIRSDSALCFVLALFFGVGVVIASRVQFLQTSLYMKAQVYLYGQAATMTDFHVKVYALLSIAIITAIFFLFKEIKVINFDKDFAETIGLKTTFIEFVTFVLVVLAVIVGIRSVGVVLMSAMLITPAIAARQFTNKLHYMFILAAIFGVISGFLGVYSSVEFPKYFSPPEEPQLIFPTGPMIVLVSAFLCLIALLFAPERGILLRYLRIANFFYRCQQENILKTFWRFGEGDGLKIGRVAQLQGSSKWKTRIILFRLQAQGWLEKKQEGYYLLTEDGRKKAARIVRLHRLWEAYLVNCLGFGVERVHKNAEEMEHIITPELEKELTELLHDPRYDPHFQPIPSKEETMS